MNIDNLIQPLSEYYGLEAVQEAIKTLKEWYEDEAYDEEDIIADWQSDAFHDAEGIDKLVEALKFNHLINNEENKRILYIYCGYYLLPDQPIPIKQPIKYHIDNNEPINEIYQEFKQKLKETLDFNPVDAKKIGDVFLYHIKEEEYDMEAIEGDLEHQDESEIIDNIIEKFPKLQNQKMKIYGILSSIIYKKLMPEISSTTPISEAINVDLNETKYIPQFNKDLVCSYIKRLQYDGNSSIPPLIYSLCLLFYYEGLTLKMQSTEQQKDEVVSLCSEWLGGICQDKYSKAVDEKAFIFAKSWDISNRFPWLSSICDTFSRFRLESHKKGCQENKNNEADVIDKFVCLQPEDWFTNIDRDCNKLIQLDSEKANYLKNAMILYFRYIMPPICLNYKMDFTIWDSLDVFARYAISINEFIYTISTSSILQCNPIQFDFLIIPKCCSKSLYQSTSIDAAELMPFPSFMNVHDIKQKSTLKIEYTCFDDHTSNTNDDVVDDDDDDDDDGGQCYNGLQSKSNIWDIEQTRLIPCGYVKDKDYFGPVLVKQDMININRMVKIFNNDLFRKVKGADYTRFNRYIIVIDRRNPKNVKYQKMTYTQECNKNWSDRIYLICPKHANKICPEYQYKMNETFMYNSKQIVIPIPNSICPDFSALSSGDGYKFVLSHHVYSQEKVKTYWYLGAGAQRFFIEDIEWLWSRYFVKENEHEKFQQLTENTKQLLQRAQNEHRLLDKQFTKYRQGYKVKT